MLESAAEPFDPLPHLYAMVGQERISAWHTVSQADIDAFARVTGDNQFIHVDPVRAAASPFGGTVAHGFLTLSLVSVLKRVPFLAPVPSGKRIRARFLLAECITRVRAEMRIRYNVTVEIKGGSKPAMIADWILLADFGDASSSVQSIGADTGEQR